MPSTKAATTTEPRTITGTVRIFIRLVFPNLQSVPSESEIGNLANTLLDSPVGLLNDPMKVDNFTYEKLSDSSFAIRQSYQIPNVSMSENTELRNETENLIQRTVNDLLNTILNKPAANTLVFPRANYTNMPNQIQVNVEYVYQEGDINQPSKFLSAILIVSGLATTTAPATTTSVAQTVSGTMPSTKAATTTEPRRHTGTVRIFIRLVFPNLQSVPSESEIGNLANTLLDSPVGLLNDPMKVDNFTYEKLSDSSFAIRQSYQIPNVSMSENTELRNETENLIQRTVNDLLNTILNKPAANTLVFPRANYTNMPNQIHVNVEYVYQEGDINQPSKFLSAILIVSGLATTTAPATTTSVAQTVSGTMPSTKAATTTEPRTITGTVKIFIRLVFPNLQSVPSESEIGNLANTLLDSPVGLLNDPMKVDNFTYEKLTVNSFAMGLSYQIFNVSMSINPDLRDETHILIQKSINKLLNIMLTSPGSDPFDFEQANYKNMHDHIQASIQYTFPNGDIKGPSTFLSAVLAVSGLATTAAPTTTTSPVLLLITDSGGSFPGWALAIIIPCGIAIILVPFWILLCCLLCGCCAAIKRRWRRRRPYNMQQYRIHPL
ncbi:hypothetical protein AAFF_G00181610 [Aldrovandia affinis]|uniref:Uncharacterized protein n=1 Tax=Aldrovandia affinis TaxID=143900 RepID=A0AAD7T0K6_9TELE|nr:hypothetical protein AAFF_G00181610 [Aldrovandia affinis]